MRIRALVAGVLVAALAPTLVATNAHGSAALGSSISLRAVQPRIDEGQSTLLRGHVRGFPRGSEIQLDRWRRGEWVPRQTKVLKASHDFQFRVTPPHGEQQFRVSVTDRDGRHVEKATTLVVRWTPEMTAEVTWQTAPNGARYPLLQGHTSYAGSGRYSLQVQYRVRPGEWSLSSWAEIHRGAFSIAGAVDTTHRWRVWLRGDGVARQESSALVVVPPVEPVRLALNDPTGTGDPVLTGYADAVIDLPADTTVTLTAPGLEDDSVVTDPAGRRVPLTGQYGSYTITTSMAGTYRVRQVPAGYGVLYASTPKVYEARIGTPQEGLLRDVPGQFVDLQFRGEAGQFVTGDLYLSTLLGPDEGFLAPTVEGAGQPTIYRLPVTGTYTLRFYDVHGDMGYPAGFDLREVPWQRATIDGPAVSLDLTEYNLVVVGAKAGQGFTFAPPSGCRPEGYQLRQVDPGAYGLPLDVWPTKDGDVVFSVTPRGDLATGELGFVSTPMFELTVDGPSVALHADDRSCAVFRGSVTATAGQIIRLADSSGQMQVSLLQAAGGPDFAPIAPHTYRVPADGEYQIVVTEGTVASRQPWSGQIAASTPEITTYPAETTEVPLTLSGSGDQVFARVDLPPGRSYRLVLDPGTVSNSGVSVRPVDVGYGYSWLDSSTRAVNTSVPGPNGLLLSGSGASAGTMTVTIIR